MSDIEIQRQAYRKVYDTGLASLLSAIWGGNLHMGLFEGGAQTLADAQVRAKDAMAAAAGLRPEMRVIEAACGVGSTARHLARRYGVAVHATNISEAQLAEAREETEKAGLAGQVDFKFADFHDLGGLADSYDCWWCQEALLYAIDKRRVLEEAARVVKPRGSVVFTDLLITRDMPEAERDDFIATLKAPDMWAIEDWDRLLGGMGIAPVVRHDWSIHTTATFAAVAKNLAEVRDRFVPLIGEAAVVATEGRIAMQLEAARARRLGWCFYAYRV